MNAYEILLIQASPFCILESDLFSVSESGLI